ncbi:MAG: hypothetical protein AAFM91_16325 [Pseudomonadota bacterium]
MPLDYQLLLLAHLLLFVYWLGGDLGVFYSSFVVVDQNRSVDARMTAARILVALDQVPRVCLILMLPVGVSLAARLGLVALPAGTLVAIWVAALAWLALVFSLHTSTNRALSVIDTAVRITLAVGAVALAAGALAGDGFTGAGWLAAKLGVFGLIVGCGLAIRRVFAPFGAAFARLANDGSSPDVEHAIRRALARARPLVLAIWVLLIAAAWLGLAKPVLS